MGSLHMGVLTGVGKVKYRNENFLCDGENKSIFPLLKREALQAQPEEQEEVRRFPHDARAVPGQLRR